MFQKILQLPNPLTLARYADGAHEEQADALDGGVLPNAGGTEHDRKTESSVHGDLIGAD